MLSLTQGLGAKVAGVFTSAIDAVISFIKSKAQDVLNAILSLIPGPIRGMISGLLGGDSPAEMPAAQFGGFTRGPTLAGEAGEQEAILPINRSARSRGLLAETASALGLVAPGAESGPTNINVSIPLRCVIWEWRRTASSLPPILLSAVPIGIRGLWNATLSVT